MKSQFLTFCRARTAAKQFEAAKKALKRATEAVNAAEEVRRRAEQAHFAARHEWESASSELQGVLADEDE